MIQNNITVVVIVLSAVLGIAVLLIVYLFLRVRRTEIECDLLTRGTHGKNFVEIVNDNIDQVEGLLNEVDNLSEQYGSVLRRMAGAIQHVGVVRFDAFRDMGGLMSFAVALLDDRGNGLVLSSIYGRSESRTYTKPVVERGSAYEMSPEEKEAIRLALQSKELGALPVIARDREHEERLATLKLFHERELGLAEGEETDARAQRPESAQRVRQRLERQLEEETKQPARPEERPDERKTGGKTQRRPPREPRDQASGRRSESAADRLRGDRTADRQRAERERAAGDRMKEERQRASDRLRPRPVEAPKSDSEPQVSRERQEPQDEDGFEFDFEVGATAAPGEREVEEKAPPRKKRSLMRPRGTDNPVERLSDGEPREE